MVSAWPGLGTSAVTAGRGLTRASGIAGRRIPRVRGTLRVHRIFSLDPGDAVGGGDQVLVVKEGHHAQDVNRTLHPGRAVLLGARLDLSVRG
jgi:hypothetical protein